MCVFSFLQSCNFEDWNKEGSELIRPATVEEAEKAIAGKWQMIAYGTDNENFKQSWRYFDFDPDGEYMELLSDGNIRYYDPETGEFWCAYCLESGHYGYATYSIDTKYLYMYQDCFEEKLKYTRIFEYQLTKTQIKLTAVPGEYELEVLPNMNVFIYQLIK